MTQELPQLDLRRLYEHRQQAILHISNMVGSVMEIDDILDDITQTTADLMSAPVCSIFLYDKAHARLVLRATHGLNPNVVGRAGFEPGEGIPGWVAQNGSLITLRNGPKDPRFAPIDGSDEEDYLGYLCAPLFIQTELIGVMTARKTGEYKFSQNETTLFETVCKQVAIVIEKSRLHRDKLESERLAAIGLSLSEISHYIKNVLQTTQGAAYFMDIGLEKGDVERVGKAWGALKRGNRKIGELVQNMLNYSRSSNPKREEINVEGLLRDLLDGVQAGADRRNVMIEPDIAPDLPSIIADSEGVHNAVLNLVTNALDAMEANGQGVLRVEAKLDASRNEIVIAVSDTGCGIPAEMQRDIFNLFFSTKGGKGTGIGLAVTKKVVEENGGRIALESEPGEGSTFRLVFPVGIKENGEE